MDVFEILLHQLSEFIHQDKLRIIEDVLVEIIAIIKVAALEKKDVQVTAQYVLTDLRISFIVPPEVLNDIQKLLRFLRLQVQYRLRSVVVEERKGHKQIFVLQAQRIEFPGKNKQKTMIVLLSGDQVNLSGRQEMYAVTLDGKGIKIDHVRARAIDENAYLIVGMPVRLLCFVRIFAILDNLPFHLIYMKSNLLITLGEFVYVDVSEHKIKIASNIKIPLENFQIIHASVNQQE
jgi:hypothetical protein